MGRLNRELEASIAHSHYKAIKNVNSNKRSVAYAKIVV
jgi:hypothetical protein